jgi:hypothetical protein
VTPIANQSSRPIVWSAGTKASSIATLCEPLPLSPMRSPQLSSIVKSLRGTIATIRSSLPAIGTSGM